jgi:hypothetical protein
LYSFRFDLFRRDTRKLQHRASGQFHSHFEFGERKNRALAGPVESLAGAKPTITFQRGTAGCTTIATWEEQRSVAYSAI